jgi:RNA polymerase sigma factor (sigma-70 family)
VGSRSDAEDVAQTTFLNAHRALVRGVQPTNERAWLLAIARNVCRKRFKALRTQLHEEPLDEATVPASEDEHPEGRLAAALATLPAMQRAVLVLHDLDGHSKGELERRLGLSSTAFDALLFRARKAVRDELRAGDAPLACAETRELVERQLANSLGKDERATLRAHLRTCTDCATKARSARARKRSGLISVLGLPWGVPAEIGTLFGRTATEAKLGAAIGAVVIGGGAGIATTGISLAPLHDHATLTAAASPISLAGGPRSRPVQPIARGSRVSRAAGSPKPGPGFLVGAPSSAPAARVEHTASPPPAARPAPSTAWSAPPATPPSPDATPQPAAAADPVTAPAVAASSPAEPLGAPTPLAPPAVDKPTVADLPADIEDIAAAAAEAVGAAGDAAPDPSAVSSQLAGPAAAVSASATVETPQVPPVTNLGTP